MKIHLTKVWYATERAYFEEDCISITFLPELQMVEVIEREDSDSILIPFHRVTLMEKKQDRTLEFQPS